MSDQRLRELERQYRRTGAPEDEAAWRRERYRVVPTFALIACVHANLEALQAVLDDIEAEGVKRVVCLGDLVAYGPDPVECVDLVLERCDVVLRGHADEALVTGNTYAWGSIRAAQTVQTARRLLLPAENAADPARERWRALSQLPERHVEGDQLFVHGSPRDPLFEYLLPADLNWSPSDVVDAKYAETFEAFERVLFVAHSHLPGVLTHELVPKTPGVMSERVVAKSDAELGYAYTLPPDLKTIVNPGSVGQPRDRDPRAAYAIVSGDEVRWRRVEYDRDRTIAKIRASADVHDMYADRLREGI